MNRRRQLYILALAAHTASLVVMAAMPWLAIQRNTVAGIVRLTVALSGNGLGGFARVPGILRDDRADRERERADKAEETAKQSEQKAIKAQQQAEPERLRAERAEAELQRVRIEAAPGLASTSDTENNEATEN